MGLAKYAEDIVSRATGDRYMRNASVKSEEPAPMVPKQTPALKKQKEELMKKKHSELNEFVLATARPLPVIILADTSGSMSNDGRITVLNNAIREMIASFAEEDDSRAEIHVAVITFGDANANLHTPLTPASKMQWTDMGAKGKTPMGSAFDLAREMLEDRAMIPSRAYSPSLVLVSDGEPNDEWQVPLKRLFASERASKAQRFSLGIGSEASNESLNAFLNDPEARAYSAHESREIRRFFKWVTMSVNYRSRSATPAKCIPIDPSEMDDLEF